MKNVMKFLVLAVVCCALHPVVSYADVKILEEITVKEVTAPTNTEPRWQVLATNGKVYYIDSIDSDLVPKIKDAQAKNFSVRIATDERRVRIFYIFRGANAADTTVGGEEAAHRSTNTTYIPGGPNTPPVYINNTAAAVSGTSTNGLAKALTPARVVVQGNGYADDSVDDINYYCADHPEYVGTNVQSYSRAEQIFNGLNPYSRQKFLFFKGAQCYQRAHYWTYQIDSVFNTKAYKIFMFYSARYRRTFREGWWFHVAPMIVVNGRPMVMDVEFTDTPLTIKKWTDEFIQNKAPCKIMRRYQEYEDSSISNSEWCLVRIVPEYYYQPMHVEAYDKGGPKETYWKDFDLAHARKGFTKK
jgi:hypothetical protein